MTNLNQSFTAKQAATIIRAALKARSTIKWSVRLEGQWIEIVSMNARKNNHGHMDADECAALTKLLGLEDTVHHQGEMVAASQAHRKEYIARAEGKVEKTPPDLTAGEFNRGE